MGSESARRKPAELPRQAEKGERALPVALLRTREAVMSRMRPILRSHGFTEQQWRVLRSLDVDIPIDKTALADRSALLMPSLLRILKDLEREDHIALVADSANKRLIRVRLTKGGATAVEETTQEISAMGSTIRAHVGAELLDDLIDCLNHVEHTLASFQG